MSPTALNYYALTVAIIGNCLPETAFMKLESDRPSLIKNVINEADMDDMVKLHNQGVYYKDLAEIYCMETTNLHKRLKTAGKIIPTRGGGKKR